MVMPIAPSLMLDAAISEAADMLNRVSDVLHPMLPADVVLGPVFEGQPTTAIGQVSRLTSRLRSTLEAVNHLQHGQAVREPPQSSNHKSNPMVHPGQGGVVNPKRDNWADRTYKMRCNTCIFFVPKSAEGRKNDIGRCRRRAPTVDGFPVVFLTDWCGDHKLDETKSAIG